MCWQSQTHANLSNGLRKTYFFRRFGKLASILVLAGAAQSCAAPPISPFTSDPSDASPRTAAVSYRTTIGHFATQ